MDTKKRALSYSSLSAFSKSPNHLLQYWEGSPSTPAQLQGQLIHKLILEPETFRDDFVVFEGKVRRGKEWEAFSEANQDRKILSLKEYNEAENIFHKVKHNKHLKDLLSRSVAVEKEITWTKEGLDFRGFVDIVGKDFIADIKTTTDAGPKFIKDVYYFNYDLQAAMYCEVYNVDYYIIAIEKTAPYNVQVYKLGPQTMYEGKKKYNKLVEKYLAWDGKPMGYFNYIVEI